MLGHVLLGGFEERGKRDRSGEAAYLLIVLS